jgi:predicted transcriptional regulator|tara:strand:+ start:204 stop:626 length:423 start_codon:yes stop_codon:yes gene_type:complete
MKATKKVRTTVKLPVTMKHIVDQRFSERSATIEEAIVDFLSWESYTDEDWSAVRVMEPIDGQPWLDSVEVGVEYRTRSKLLPAIVIELTPETAEAVEVAAKRAESVRSALKGKGTKSGVIRAALAHYQTRNMYGGTMVAD